MSRFETAVARADGPLSGAWKPGLEALSRTHRVRVQAHRPRALTGSVDLDGALAQGEPNAARWDYGVGYRHRDGVECAHWIEVHPATSKHVSAILSKLRWLKTHLKRNAPELAAMTGGPGRGPAYVWIHTGYDRVLRTTRVRRVFAEEGLIGPVREVKLP